VAEDNTLSNCNNNDLILNFIKCSNFFESFDNSDRARLYPYLEVVELKPDSVLFQEESTADYLYFLLKGRVQTAVKNKTDDSACDLPACIDANNKSGYVLGTEAAFAESCYQKTVVAETDILVIRLPAIVIQTFVQEKPSIGSNLFFRQKKDKQNNLATDESPYSQPMDTLKNIIAWIFAFVLPIAVYHTLDGNVNNNARLLMSAISGAMVLWLFKNVYEFVPPLLVLIAMLALGIMPDKDCLSGFSSDSYLLILSLSGVASVIISSGLFYRFSIYILKALPANQSWYSMGLLAICSVITPLIPSALGRTMLVAPLVKNITEALKTKDGSILSTKLSLANFFGVNCLGTFFFTGSLLNFMAVGVIPNNDGGNSSSLGGALEWGTTAFVAGLVVLLTTMFSLALLFHDRTRLKISKDIITKQWELLGDLKNKEWNALIAILFFIVTIILISAKVTQFSWICLFLFFALSALKIIKIDEWAKHTDWSFLFLVGASLGVLGAMRPLGIHKIISDNLLPYLNFFGESGAQVLAAIVAVTILLRFIANAGPVFIIMSGIGLPIAESVGLNPWITVFSILWACDIWFFPYQSLVYQKFESFFKGGLPYNKSYFLAFNGLISLTKILSLYLSVPYWQQMGLL